MRAGCLVHLDIVGRHIIGPRHSVVVVGAADQLTCVSVVDGVFEYGRADALSDTAVHLAFNDHRIDHCSHIIDGRDLDDLHLTGVRIDFYFADLGSRRICEVGGIVKSRFFESRLETFRIIVRDIGRKRDFAHRHAPVRARHRERSAVVFDIRLGRL